MTLKSNPSRRRRWLQISLRTFLVASCLLAIGLGWLGNELYRLRNQRQVAARIESLGAKLDYDYRNYEDHEFFYFPTPDEDVSTARVPAWVRRILGDDAFARIVWVSFDSSCQISDQDLAVLSHLPNLRYVEVYSRVSDVGVGHLSRLHNLQYLALSDARVTTEGCKAIASLRSLEELEITGRIMDKGLTHILSLPNLRALKVNGDITDEGMARIACCPSIEALHVGDSPKVTDHGIIQLRQLPRLRLFQLNLVGMTDEGASHLARMQQLRSLFIADTSLTDAGLRNLHKLKNLVELQVHGDGISESAAMELKSALPDCQLITSYFDRPVDRSINIRLERY